MERAIFTGVWEVRGPVNRGDALKLEYRIDENQVFHFRLTLRDSDHGEPFTGKIENPLSNVVNPHAKRLKIHEAEEDIRTGKVPAAEIPDRVVEIARDYAELQQTEKAISYLKRALQLKNRPDTYILNLLGIYHGEVGDFEKQEKFYREAAAASRDYSPLFNLALAQYRRKQFTKALKTVDEAIERGGGEGPSFTLKAQIAEALDKSKISSASLKEAFEHFEGQDSIPLKQFSDWELGWYITACRMAAEKKKLDAAIKEQSRRKDKLGDSSLVAGQLPTVAQTLAKR